MSYAFGTLAKGIGLVPFQERRKTNESTQKQ